jgi:imidazolonepropionase-like amidohydrolase
MKKSTLTLIISMLITIVRSQDTIAIINVSLIDMKADKIEENITVLISGNRIVGVGKKIKLPKTITIINGSGKYLMPGLWDMHAHMIWRERLFVFLPLYIANGITGIRDMGTGLKDFKAFKEWQYSLTSDSLTTRIIAPGPVLDGPKPTNPATAIAVGNEEQARKAVQQLKQNGSDFIKIYNLLPREAYFAILDESKKQGLDVAGHLPFSIKMEEAIKAGQKSIEHLNKCILSCSDDRDTLEEALRLATFETNGPVSWQAREVYDEKALIRKNQQKAEKLYELMKTYHLYQCPTLLLRKFFSDSVAVNRFMVHPYFNYYSASFRKDLENRYRNFFAIRKEDDLQRAQLLYGESLRQVKAMHDAGVLLLAGTDVPGFGSFPGLSLHNELSLFVEAGLSPYEALKTATVNPAAYFNFSNDLGTVEKGKYADLLLLDDNPLKDIHNTQKIFAVVVNGKYLDRKHLDALLKMPQAQN